MREPLYALQRDVDMIATQVQTLTLSLGKLDWIAQMLKKLDDELTCQGQQMRRMEVDIRELKQDVSTLKLEVSGLKLDVGKIKKHLKIK